MQKEIELNDEECKIVLTKLHDFGKVSCITFLVSKFKTNLPLEQKNSLDNCDSTTAEPENFCRRKSLENFSIAFNKLTNKIQNLMAQETTEKIEEIVRKFFILHRKRFMTANTRMTQVKN